MKSNTLGIKRLPVIPVRQEYDYDCGKAAVKTLLNSVGIRFEDNMLQDMLGTNEITGTHPTRIVKTLKKLGLSIKEVVGAGLADLEKLIGDNYYCLVVYQAWGTDREHRRLESGHYSLAYGVDGELVHLADPLAEESDGYGLGDGLRYLKKNEFDRDWVDEDLEGNRYDHWMLAVKV